MRSWTGPFMLATGVIIVGVGFAVGPVTLVFYATVAQVLPVLLLAVIFEGRFATLLQGGDRASRFSFRAEFVLMLCGEAAALVAIAGVGDNVVVRGLVATALGWSTLLLVLHASVTPALHRHPTRLAARRQRSSAQRHRARPPASASRQLTGAGVSGRPTHAVPVASGARPPGRLPPPPAGQEHVRTRRSFWKVCVREHPARRALQRTPRPPSGRPSGAPERDPATSSIPDSMTLDIIDLQRSNRVSGQNRVRGRAHLPFDGWSYRGCNRRIARSR